MAKSLTLKDLDRGRAETLSRELPSHLKLVERKTRKPKPNSVFLLAVLFLACR
jgi:hypothetical protein